uniref:Uncharacterized protein n=1 Tax=Lactuca sativa TaxID=4236 RepID=A0A9R1XRP2_LACSA|nr:hypothetical protein LSAT_V11C300124710 [Lactuca sativa]
MDGFELSLEEAEDVSFKEMPRRIGRPLAENIELGAQCFTTMQTPSGNFLVSCGNWENSFQLISLNDGRLVQSVRQHKDDWSTGLYSVTLADLKNAKHDISSNERTYQVGTEGESLGFDKTDAANSSLWTHGTELPTNQSLIWNKSIFIAPEGKGPLSLNLGSMGKGEAWVNGQSIGRYWSTYLSPSTGCTNNCDYRGTYNAQKCQKKCGQPAQNLYHVPRTLVHPGENLVVLHEELGGDPSKIYVLTRTGLKVCGHVLEDDPIPAGKFHRLVLLALGIPKGIVVPDLLKAIVILTLYRSLNRGRPLYMLKGRSRRHCCRLAFWDYVEKKQLGATKAEWSLKLGAVNPDDLGYVDSISVVEVGGARVTVIRNEQGGNSMITVLLRGGTDNILDDLERAVDDGVNTYKALCKDNKIMPGAAAIEIELARKLKEFSFSETGLDQYAIGKFAESFEMIPKTLAENVGLNAMEITSTLYADHTNGNVKVGLMKANSSGVRRGKESAS